jgi:hypothetical protein
MDARARRSLPEPGRCKSAHRKNRDGNGKTGEDVSALLSRRRVAHDALPTNV